MLKADLHLHVQGDPYDKWITHDAKQLIDHAAALNFNVLSITLHGKVWYPKNIVEYAKKKNILLIPGTEAWVEGKHVLLYNFTQKQVNKIKTFADLRHIKQQNQLAIAAHPYYPNNSCAKELINHNHDVLDGFEHCHLWTHYINFNKKTINAAKKYNKALIGNSDTHYLWQMGSNYTLINAKPAMQSVFAAIRSQKTQLVTKPATLKTLIKDCLFIALPEKLKKYVR